MPGIYSMPQVEATTIKKAVKHSAVREDLHKFMGYEAVLPRYLSIPYDTPTNATLENFFSDTGFLIILLLPLLFLSFGTQFSPQKQFLLNFLIILLGSLLLTVSVSSAFMNKNNLQSPEAALTLLDSKKAKNTIQHLSNLITKTTLHTYQPFYQISTKISGQRDYVTYPILIGIFALLLFAFRQRIKHFLLPDQALIIFTSLYFFLWWVLGSGMSWYGLILFILPYFFIIGYLNKVEKITKNAKATAVLSFCLLWILFAFVFRSVNYNPVNKTRAQISSSINLSFFVKRIINKKRAMESSFPSVTQFSKIINQNRKGKVYRVGTALKFFIDRNDIRVYDDTFMDFFEKMVQEIQDKQKIIRGLKMNGFEYILFDLNMANSDFTPEKSLTKKFTNFLNTLYRNPAIIALEKD
jgi:hypothetical protein